MPQRLTATINGKLKLDLDMDGGLIGEWANAFLQAPLKQGSNTVKLSGGDERLSLDSIDVLPPGDRDAKSDREG